MSMTKGTDTTTEKVSYPEYVNSALEGYYDELGSYFGDARDSGGAPLADLTPAQEQAFYLQERMLDKPVSNWSERIAGAGEQGYTAAQVTPEAIKEQMNPFLDEVGRSTIDAMSRERSNEDARIGARNASSVAFGGSGAALERGQLNRSYGENVGKAINDLMAQGYDQATSVALANAQMENQARGQNANNLLAGYSQAGQADSDAFQRQRQAINDRLQGGTLEQEYRQRSAERPWDLLQQFGSILPNAPVTRTSSSPNQFSPLQTLLGVGLSVGGMPTGYAQAADGTISGGGSLLGSWLS